MARIFYDKTETYTTTAVTVAPGDTLIISGASQLFGNFGEQYGPMINAMRSRTTVNGTTTTTYANVFNAGKINTDSDGITLANGANLTNSGAILVVGTRDYFGVYSSGVAANSVVNTGLIATNSTSVGAVALAVFATTNVLNNGEISAYNKGYAVDVFGYSINLINNGLIYGANAVSTTGSSITNNGMMIGNTAFDFGINIFNNHGLVDGSLTGGSDVDTMDNFHGTITGNVDLGAGNDVLSNVGGVIKGIVIGGLGDDTITGGDGRDVIYGDNVSGDTTGGNDVIYGGYGDDSLFGGYGDDTIQGNQGDDLLQGNQGNDYLHGGQGDDQLFGGQGNDILNGGVGNDVLTGGLGNDTFVFSQGFGHDTVADFGRVSGNNDVLQFQAGTFGSFAEVQSHEVQQGANVLITLNANDSVLVLNTTVAALTADHFLFG